MTAGPRDEAGFWGHYAGLISRFAAYAVDLAVITALFGLALAAVSFAASLVSGHSVNWTRSDWLVAVLYGCWWLLYFGYSLAADGATFGMALLGVQVVSREGDTAGPRRSIIRTLAFPLSFLLCGLGFAGILVGRERRALHDVIAGTCVVYAWDARPQRLRFLAGENVTVPAQAGPPARESAASRDLGSARGDAAQQFIDQPPGEPRRGGRGVVPAAGHDGAGKGEHGDLDVGVGTQLTGGDTAAEH